MRQLLEELRIRATCFPRLLWYRLLGVRVSLGAVVRGGCEISGKVVVGKGVKIGKDVRIKGSVAVGDGCIVEHSVQLLGNVAIGRNTVVGSCSVLSTGPLGRLTIGNDVHVNCFSILGATERIEIEDHCIFAPYVQITDAEHGFEDPAGLIKHERISAEPVVIHENAWLGSGVVVLKGVDIGAGAVIGAKSLVTRSIPPLSVAYGVPAKVARFRGGGAVPVADEPGFPEEMKSTCQRR